jgi:hypothetical protein
MFSFKKIILFLHRWVGLISGLVFWWPKRWNKSTRRQSFKITSRAS